MKLETFFEEFDLFAGVPDAVAKMRELVLHLAVHGNLVSQSGDDEPAAQLLQRSRAAMAKLMATGKAKKEKLAEPVSDGEATFSLPRGWAWCRLVDAGQFINGLAFKPSDWGAVGRPIIRIQNLSGRNLDYNRTTGTFDSSVLVRDGDILVSWSATLDAFVWRGEEAVLNQHIFRVLPAPLADQGFLFWLLKWVIRQLAESDHAHGLVMSHINRGPFLAHPIPLPPLAEQKRIVAKVDELMALCDRLEAQQQERETRHTTLAQASLARFADVPTPANLNLLFHPSYAIAPADLRKSILALAVQGKLVPQDPNDEPASNLIARAQEERKQLIEAGVMKRVKRLEEKGSTRESIAVPVNWAFCPLDDIALKITDGEHATPARQEQGHYLLSARNVRDGFIDVSDVDYVGTDEFERIRKRCDPNAGDILLSCSGSVGRVAVVDADNKYAMVRSAALIKHSKTNVDSHYLSLALRSPCLQRQIEQSSKQSAQANLFIEPIRRLVVPIPPLAEQHRIVAKVEQLMALVDALETQLAASRTTAANLLSALVADLTEGNYQPVLPTAA